MILPRKTLQEAMRPRISFRNLKKKKVLVDFCFSVTFFWIPFLQASHNEQNQGESQCPDNSTGRAAAAGQRCFCFLICNVNTSAQQFAHDYSVA